MSEYKLVLANLLGCNCIPGLLDESVLLKMVLLSKSKVSHLVSVRGTSFSELDE